MKSNRNRSKISKKSKSILSLRKPNKQNKRKKKQPISRKKLTKTNSNSPNNVIENVSVVYIYKKIYIIYMLILFQIFLDFFN